MPFEIFFFNDDFYQTYILVISQQLICNYHCNLSEITELKYTSLIKIIIKEENLKWHLEAFASELFIYRTFILFGLNAMIG